MVAKCNRKAKHKNHYWLVNAVVHTDVLKCIYLIKVSGAQNSGVTDQHIDSTRVLLKYFLAKLRNLTRVCEVTQQNCALLAMLVACLRYLLKAYMPVAPWHFV